MVGVRRYSNYRKKSEEMTLVVVALIWRFEEMMVVEGLKRCLKSFWSASAAAALWAGSLEMTSVESNVEQLNCEVLSLAILLTSFFVHEDV